MTASAEEPLTGWEADLLAQGALAEDTAAILASYDGPRHYQGRATLPGGRIIVAGVHGASRDTARDALAALFRTDPRHWGITKIPRPPRTAGTGRADHLPPARPAPAQDTHPTEEDS